MNTPETAGETATFDLWFDQCSDGLFFMMLDQPLTWSDQIDKDAALERIFQTQRITRLNQAMLDQYGATMDDMLGATPADFFAHDLEHGRDLWRRFFDEGHLHVVSNERRADGTLMWVEGDYTCLFDAQGRVTGHFGIQRDITRRKRNEELLELQQRLGQQLAEASELEGLLDRILRTLLALEDLQGAGIYLSERDGGLRLAAHAGLPESFIAQTRRHEPDAPNAVLVQRGDPLFQSYASLRAAVGKDGQTHGLRAVAVLPFRHGERVVGAINVASTVTDDFHPDERESLLAIAAMIGGAVARAQSEARLRQQRQDLAALFDAIDDYLFVLDTSGRVIHYNSTVLERLGFSGEELLQATALDLHPPERREEASKIIEEMLRGETDHCPIPLRRKDGGLIPVETRISLGRWDDQDVILGISRDISSRLEAQAERERLERHLRHARKMEALGVLAGGIAHDFNNILAVIRGAAELALDVTQGENGRAREDIEEILGASQRGTELVTQILAFSRRSDPRLEPLDINREIGRLQSLLRRTLPRMIDIRLRTEPNLWYVEGDAGQLSLALMNLTSNASDAMPRGGVLNISTHNLQLEQPEERGVPLPPGRYVEIVVQDTGEGMAPDVLAQAFDPFFTTKGPGKGTGLGLASTYGIVQSHGGWINLQSSRGQGTTCTVVLPASDDGQGPHDTPTESADTDRPTLLVVDDDDALRRTMKRQLERARHQVLVAASGEEALELYRHEGQHIDLVLLDLGMPGMGGARCLEALNELDPSLPVIVLSGYPPQEVSHALDGLDAAYVVTKPVARDVLFELIQRALSKSHQAS